MFIVGSGKSDNVVLNSAQVVCFQKGDYDIVAFLSDGCTVKVAEYPSTLGNDLAFSSLIDALSENAVMLYYMPTIQDVWEMIKNANCEKAEDY